MADATACIVGVGTSEAFGFDQAMAKGYQAVLLCSTTLRLPLRRVLEKSLPGLHVLAYNEVASRADVEFVGQVLAA